MGSRQCSWCGAPRREGNQAPCAFCGTIEEPPARQTGGPALCVCEVMATWRCTLCDTPVCEQHRNRFWPGQGRGNLRLASLYEWTIWDDGANAPAGSIGLHAVEACTVCRSRFAATNLERFRGMRLRAGTTPFGYMLALARAQVYSPRSFTGIPAGEFLAGLADECLRRGWGPRSVATAWTVVGGRLSRAKNPISCFVFATTTGTSLLARTPNLAICGPVPLVVHGPLLVPVANPRDAICVVKPTPGVDPRLGTLKYALRWRPPGSSAQDLGVSSYHDLLAPLARSG